MSVRRQAQIVGVIVFAVVVAGCAATRTKRTWVSPELRGPVEKVAVVAVTQRPGFREGFENRLVEQLNAVGAQAQTTFEVLTLDEILKDKQAAAARLTGRGAQGVLIMRLIDRESRYTQGRIDDRRWNPDAVELHSIGWHDYYSFGFTDLSIPQSSVSEFVYLETALFDLQTGAELWSALTETYITEDMDRLAEVDRVIRKIARAMERDGAVP